MFPPRSHKRSRNRYTQRGGSRRLAVMKWLRQQFIKARNIAHRLRKRHRIS